MMLDSNKLVVKEGPNPKCNLIIATLFNKIRQTHLYYNLHSSHTLQQFGIFLINYQYKTFYIYRKYYMKKPIFNKIYKHLNIPKETLFFEKLVYDENGFIILLSDANTTKLISINFDFVLFFRGIDESNLLRDVEQSPDIGFWSLYEINNSYLISEFHKLSLGIHNNIEIQHFGVYTQSVCMDILSPNKPIIKIEIENNFCN